MLKSENNRCSRLKLAQVGYNWGPLYSFSTRNINYQESDLFLLADLK